MSKYPHKFFERDRLVRDKNMKPLGRVILAQPYKEGENIAVTLLRVPRSLCEKVLGAVFYIDEQPYRVPVEVDPVKVGGNKMEHLVNNFYLEYIGE